MHAAEFTFVTPHAPMLCQALAPEASDETGDRSSALISLENDRLTLRVAAGDISALRAALNMWLRLITIAEDMQEIDSHGKS
ncbi:MAG TPA: hypothetical protein HA365_00300 [Methanocalculus sp.]|nr:hypothetical protein [Methanocalculus sp.]